MSRKSRQLRAGEVLIMCDGKPDCITLTDEEIAGLTPDDFLEAISNCCFDDLVVARMPNGQLRLVESYHFDGFEFVSEAQIRETADGGFEVLSTGELLDSFDEALASAA